MKGWKFGNYALLFWAVTFAVTVIWVHTHPDECFTDTECMEMNGGDGYGD